MIVLVLQGFGYFRKCDYGLPVLQVLDKERKFEPFLRCYLYLIINYRVWITEGYITSLGLTGGELLDYGK